MMKQSVQIFLKFILVCVFLSAHDAFAIQCKDLFVPGQTPKASNSRSMKNLTELEGIFTKARSLKSYRWALGSLFSLSLEKLLTMPDGHWFDSGAGHAIAVRQALVSPEGQRLKATVVAYETSAQPEPRLKVISGRFLESIADKEIPLSHLITDVFGPMAYSSQPSVILQKYLNILQPNGEIYIFLGSQHELYGLNNKVVTSSGKILSFAEWLQQVPDLRTELIKTEVNDDGNIYEKWTIKIEKLKPDIRVPQLEMTHFIEGGPPTMTFREADAGKNSISASQLQQKAREDFRKKMHTVTASQFLDFFRAGEITNPLIASLKRLDKEQLWVNLSEAGDLFFHEIKNKNYSFQETNIFFNISQRLIEWRASGIDGDQLNHLSLNDSAGLQKIKNIKLMTDYYGDFMSAFAPDVTLRRYTESLADNGEIYIYLGPEIGGLGSEAAVMTRNGDKVSMRSWLASIPGLKVKLYRGGYAYAGGEWTFVKIQISDRTFIRIPSLRLIGTFEGAGGLQIPFFEEH